MTDPGWWEYFAYPGAIAALIIMLMWGLNEIFKNGGPGDGPTRMP